MKGERGLTVSEWELLAVRLRHIEKRLQVARRNLPWWFPEGAKQTFNEVVELLDSMATVFQGAFSRIAERIEEVQHPPVVPSDLPRFRSRPYHVAEGSVLMAVLKASKAVVSSLPGWYLAYGWWDEDPPGVFAGANPPILVNGWSVVGPFGTEDAARLCGLSMQEAYERGVGG